MPCAEALAAQAEAKGEEEPVTVFSDAHFCGVETGDTPRPKAKVTMSPPNGEFLFIHVQVWATRMTTCFIYRDLDQMD